jgi:hypothetical protein
MRGGFGGFGGRGFGGWGYGGFYPWFGGYGLGYGYGYPWLYGGYGLGLGYGLGYGGYGGYGLGYGGYGGYGYGYPGYGGYGYGNPYYNGYMVPTYGAGYSQPLSATVNMTATPTASQRRYLGITEEPVVDANGKRAMKVASVYPGTPAEKAGLKVGDVIESVNGYMTETPGNLAWIIANATQDNVLRINLRSATDGQVRVIAANIP